MGPQVWLEVGVGVTLQDPGDLEIREERCLSRCRQGEQMFGPSRVAGDLGLGGPGRGEMGEPVAGTRGGQGSLGQRAWQPGGMRGNRRVGGWAGPRTGAGPGVGGTVWQHLGCDASAWGAGPLHSPVGRGLASGNSSALLPAVAVAGRWQLRVSL